MQIEISDIYDNHSIAYCMLGYYCAYFRYYHPIEFITAFLNNAANEEDQANGVKLMRLYGIHIQNPKWGTSRGDFYFDKNNNTIYKGISSVKYVGEDVSEELYLLSKENKYLFFSDLVMDLSSKTSINKRQLDVLIKIDYFRDFGNQRELFKICDMLEVFKNGEAKQVKKSLIEGTPLESIVKKYSTGTTKSGEQAKNYTILDITSIIHEAELLIKSLNIEDLGVLIKSRNFADIMGYTGYVSGNEDDRRKLYIKDVFPVKRKKDGVQFGYNILTQSIGSGVESRFSVLNRIYNKDPIKKDDIIMCNSYERKGLYFELTGYSHIYA